VLLLLLLLLLLLPQCGCSCCGRPALRSAAAFCIWGSNRCCNL
jgi:hypothetical protein